MQIVIDIPNNEYTRIVSDPDYENIYGKSICKIIKNGIALPEKHGKLIDEDILRYRLRDSYLDSFGHMRVAKVLENMDAIIEVDGGDAE